MKKGRLFMWIVVIVIVTWGGSVGLSMVMVPPSERTPNTGYKGVILSTEADRILKKACFDCHSNESRWPWYSYMPVVAVLVAHDVKDGREELNFSDWDRMENRRKSKKLKETFKSIDEGEMPMPIYLITHPEADLTAAEIKTLKAAARFKGWNGR